MQRRIVTPILVVSFLAVAALASYWGIPRTTLSANPNDVDHVALYQNGLAAITLSRPFQGVGGDQVLELSLPTTTIFDSLSVTGDGVAVKELRSSLSADPALHPGDKLTVRTDDGASMAGTFLSMDNGQLLLSKEGGTVVIQMSHVTVVEVSGRTVDPSGPGTTTVSVLVNTSPGAHSVTVSYLAQGVGWSPNYILDPTTGAMTFFATLTGLQDWHNVTLDLVAGNPNMVFSHTLNEYDLKLSGTTGAGFYDSAATSTYAPPFGGSESLGAMHRYHYNGKVDLALGQTVRLPVVTGNVDVVRHYFRADSSAYTQDWRALPEIYQIRNTLGETLPSGPVRVYLDGAWIGADNLQALGKGEQGNVTVSYSDDVKTQTTIDSQTRSEPRFPDAKPEFGGRRQLVTVTTTYDMQVRNLGDQELDLHATFQANEGGTTKVLTITPRPTHEQQQARIWDETLDGGQTLHHKVTIETVEETYVG